jgi:hypothetical protein
LSRIEAFAAADGLIGSSKSGRSVVGNLSKAFKLSPLAAVAVVGEHGWNRDATLLQMLPQRRQQNSWMSHACRLTDFLLRRQQSLPKKASPCLGFQ